MMADNHAKAYGALARLAKAGLVKLDNDAARRLRLRAAMLGDFTFLWEVGFHEA